MIILAALEDELAKLNLNSDVLDYILDLKRSNNKLSGLIFSHVKKNPALSIEQVKELYNALSNRDTKKEQDKIKDLPESWVLAIKNYPNISIWIRKLFRKNKSLPEFDSVKFELIVNYLKETKLQLDDQSFDHIFELAKNYDLEHTKVQVEETPKEYKQLADTINNPELKNWFLNLKELPKLENLVDKINIIEHFIAETPTYKIKDQSFHDLYKIAKEWEDSFTKSNVKNIPLDQSRMVYKFEDGHFIYELKLKEELVKEGSDLRHCVGGYFDYVESGKKRIFSVRTSANKALVTIDCSPDLYQFTQTYGYYNSEPTTEQMSLVNEWKISLHPKDKIINLAKSKDIKERIQSAQFMDYKDPDYKILIDAFISNKSEAIEEEFSYANQSVNVIEALSQNETLDEKCFELIYLKNEYSEKIKFNLIRNKSIGSDLFKEIFYKYNVNDDYNLYKAMLSSYAIARPECKEIISHLTKTPGEFDLTFLLNNTSIPGEILTNILDTTEVKVKEGHREVEGLSKFEPKLISSILSSNNFDKLSSLIVYIKNENIKDREDILSKIKSKFKISASANYEEIIKQLVLKGANKGYDKFLDFFSSESTEDFIGMMNDNQSFSVDYISYDYIQHDFGYFEKRNALNFIYTKKVVRRLVEVPVKYFTFKEIVAIIKSIGSNNLLMDPETKDIAKDFLIKASYSNFFYSLIKVLTDEECKKLFGTEKQSKLQELTSSIKGEGFYKIMDNVRSSSSPDELNDLCDLYESYKKEVPEVSLNDQDFYNSILKNKNTSKELFMKVLSSTTPLNNLFTEEVTKGLSEEKLELLYDACSDKFTTQSVYPIKALKSLNVTDDKLQEIQLERSPSNLAKIIITHPNFDFDEGDYQEAYYANQNVLVQFIKHMFVERSAYYNKGTENFDASIAIKCINVIDRFNASDTNLMIKSINFPSHLLMKFIEDSKFFKSLNDENVNKLISMNDNKINKEIAGHSTLNEEQCIKLINYRPIAIHKLNPRFPELLAKFKNKNKYEELSSTASLFYKLITLS